MGRTDGRRSLRFASLALLLACVLTARAGRGDPSASIVTIVRSASGDRVTREASVRLEGELVAAGFQVRVVASETEAEGIATIAIRTTNRGCFADVSVLDKLAGASIERRVDVGDPGLSTAPSDLAVRSVELLRASLLDVAKSAAPQKGVPADVARFATEPPLPSPVLVDVPDRRAPPRVAIATRPLAAPPPAPAPRAPPRRASALDRPQGIEAPPAPRAPEREGAPSRVRVEAGAQLLASTGGLGASPRPYVRAGLVLGGAISAHATFGAGVAAASFASPTNTSAGTVDVAQDTGVLDLALRLGDDRARWTGLVALGAGFHRMRVDGRSRAPYVAEHHDDLSFLAAARAGLGLALTDRIGVRAELGVAVVAPRPEVSIAGASVGSLGPVALAPALGLVTKF